MTSLPCLQDRVGGRIWTVPYGEVQAELGAQFIYGAESSIDNTSQVRPAAGVRPVHGCLMAAAKAAAPHAGHC